MLYKKYRKGPCAGYEGFWSFGPLTVFKSTDGMLNFHVR